MARRKPAPFTGGRAQMFCILDEDSQLWSYTTFAFECDAMAYLKHRLEQLGRSTDGYRVSKCVVTLQI